MHSTQGASIKFVLKQVSSPQKMLKISVLVITLNEENNIGRCLASVAGIADEIIVIDSFSTDNTVAIAESYGAQVIQQAFIGYGQQKNMGSSLARNSWILSLDADECLTPELKTAISTIAETTTYPAFEIARLTSYCGQWIRYCGWYPDKQTRLYNRTKGNWIEQKVHEYWQPTHNEKKGRLRGNLLHYSFTSTAAHLKKIEKYTDLSAQEAFRKRKNASLFKLIFSPFWHFFTDYFIRLGFLDGYYGYIICRLSAYAAFLKCLKTRMHFVAATTQKES